VGFRLKVHIFVGFSSPNRENGNAQAASTDRALTAWGTGMNPTGRYPHMFEERGEKEIYPNNNRDPYKEEIKITPPHPPKRKNINFFFPLEGSIFSL
jgi:hypothetical protein